MTDEAVGSDVSIPPLQAAEGKLPEADANRQPDIGMDRLTSGYRQ